ncbi:hypothetical protein BJV78DRAFT_1128264 [Lactifluus subvellereus]|nr:hypothetical protein BJV78DRAFT_1128264 [Lactifluus subvellereus]
MVPQRPHPLQSSSSSPWSLPPVLERSPSLPNPVQSQPPQTQTQTQSQAQSPPAQSQAQSPPAQSQAQSPPAQSQAQSPPAQSQAQSPPAQFQAQSPPTQTQSQAQSLPSQPQQLHPEIRSVVSLTHAHAHKVYMSGPMVRRIERLPDGHQPTKDEGWREVWAQLGGTTLSIWDMKEIEEANKQGREVPPAYINVTDAFVQVLGAVTIPATGSSPAQKYNNVVTLNTAGSNLILFSCPSAASLISWATALRLAAWEKSRLEEIYTAHLIRITLNDGRDAPSTLVRGRREGWVRIRIAGQTDWKHLWMVVSSGTQQEAPGSPAQPGSPHEPQRRKRISTLFGREENQSLSISNIPLVAFYLSPRPKDKKKPFLTLQIVTQAFAVYPERPELINKSTLMKIEGTIGNEDVAMGMRGKEGWILVMPELEAGVPQMKETIRWLIAFHDAFSQYGRPRSYSWDPRDPSSMMYAYPVGPNRNVSFLPQCIVPHSLTSLFRCCSWNENQQRAWIHGLPALPLFDLVS